MTHLSGGAERSVTVAFHNPEIEEVEESGVSEHDVRELIDFIVFPAAFYYPGGRKDAASLLDFGVRRSYFAGSFGP